MASSDLGSWSTCAGCAAAPACIIGLQAGSRRVAASPRHWVALHVHRLVGWLSPGRETSTLSSKSVAAGVRPTRAIAADPPRAASEPRNAAVTLGDGVRGTRVRLCEV
eukprot:scaffold129355_cov63-Phaeocystis_antarctica.AAC.5